jgi:hypothetical protein
MSASEMFLKTVLAIATTVTNNYEIRYTLKNIFTMKIICQTIKQLEKDSNE